MVGGLSREKWELGIPGLVNIHSLLLNMAIEIVEFPINSIVMFHSYVFAIEAMAIEIVDLHGFTHEKYGDWIFP